MEWGVMQVCRMGVEAACGLLEVAWSSGQMAAVEAALLPLQTLSSNSSLDQRGPPVSSPCQQQVRNVLTEFGVKQPQLRETAHIFSQAHTWQFGARLLPGKASSTC